VTAADEISTLLDQYGPPAPSLLPWAARWVSPDDQLLVGRAAAAQAALAPSRRWPAVTDGVTEVLAQRDNEDPRLILGLVDVLPPVAAHLNPAQLTALAGADVRADALGYAALGQSGALIGKATLQTIGPEWQEVLSAAQNRAVPPLASFPLLAQLASGSLGPPGDRLGSEVVYLLPALGAESLHEDWTEAAVAEIEDWLPANPPWYAAALYARAIPYLDDHQRARLRDGASELPRDWEELFEQLSRSNLTRWPSAALELAASHPSMPRLEQLAEHADRTDLARACQEITRRISDEYGDPALELWVATPGAEAGPEGEPTPRVIRPGWVDRRQVALAVPEVEVGAGERLQLAGVSTRYRLLNFVCPSCQAPQYRIYYDESDLPVCKDGHDPMELR
jgi:hypothetical protein